MPAAGARTGSLVAFRPKHRADADHAALTRLDERASQAAGRHPGFMYSFVGTPQADGSCLSFCLWRSRAAAAAAAAAPEHRAAMLLGLPWFEPYRLDRYRVAKGPAPAPSSRYRLLPRRRSPSAARRRASGRTEGAGGARRRRGAHSRGREDALA